MLRPSGWHSIYFKNTETGIVATHAQYGVLPVAHLSDGIRTLIGVTADIAHRAIRLNSQLGREAVTSTPGIVLIDEVDMHLHPEWQQVIIESLRNAFPRIQFIVTTHSPQVLTTVRKEHIRLLAADGTASIPVDGTAVSNQSGERRCLAAPGPPDNRSLIDTRSSGKLQQPWIKRLSGLSAMEAKTLIFHWLFSRHKRILVINA